MIVKISINEQFVKPAYLKSIYDLIEENNCYQETTFEDKYDSDRRRYSKIRIIEIIGSDTMVSYLLLKLQRYNYKIIQLNNGVI